MWDLETLRFLNEQAVLKQRMVNGERIGEKDFKMEPVFPLSILSMKLRVGPPSLSYLVSRIMNSGSLAEFHDLVTAFLPEHEATIMSQIYDVDKLRAFIRYFDSKYFPLSEMYIDAYDDYALEMFTREIPVELYGFSYSDYHEFINFRPGMILLLALIASPYDDDARIPILEESVSIVGKELVQAIPIGGVGLGDIHQKLDGTQYEGVTAVADWLYSNTECWQLDANYEDYSMEFWSTYVVDNLTLQWPKVLELQEKMAKTYEWLEEDIHYNFRELLCVVLDLDEKPFVVPKEQMRLPL